MLRRLTAASSLVALILLGLAPGPALGATVVGTPIELLASEADLVVRAEVRAVESALFEGRVVTTVALTVFDSYGGVAPEELEVVVPGGRMGHFVTRVHGVETYEVGEEVLVLLERRDDGRFMSVSMSLSKFTIVRDGPIPMAVREIDTAHVITTPGLPASALESAAPLRSLEALFRATRMGLR